MAMGEDGSLCKLFADDDCKFRHVSGDLFSILDRWEKCMNGAGDGGGGAPCSAAALSPSSVVVIDGAAENNAVGARPKPGSPRREAADEEKGGADPVRKKRKGSTVAMAPAVVEDVSDGAAKMSSHITVERNRRKQMNENLAVLRTLMPCFYVKRGDQASVIGGVVDYIKELQQVLHSLEAKKHRKVYAAEHALSPRVSPRPLLKPPISPRPAVPISPPTPTPGSPYKPIQRLPHYISPATSSSSTSHAASYDIISPRPYLPTLDSIVTELAAQAAARAPVLLGGGSGGAGLLLDLLPDVKVEFAGPNLVLKTMSHLARPGQVLRIIAALENLSLEILHVSISSVDGTMVHSFTIKIGIECELSAEELVQEIRQTFL